MRYRLRQFMLATGFALPVLLGNSPVFAAKPSAEQALELKPMQVDVDYERPEKAEVAQCTVEVESKGNSTGWVVRGSGGQILRRFSDTNGDNKVDLWCYFKDGIEVYRDIDLNFNGKADQYRWLGTAGVRWGIDKDEDGRIDSWKQISPEEVTAEVVAAVRDRDASRFAAVLLSSDEIESLGLGTEHAAEMKKRCTEAAANFVEAARKQRAVGAKSQWINFGATRPGVIVAGTDGSKSDVTVYDNVAAVIETEGKHSQLVIGTLVRTGDSWKVFELPKNLTEELAGAATTGFFFAGVSETRAPQPMNPMAGVPGQISAAMQKLVADLEKIDKALATASPNQQVKLQTERADLLEKVIAAVTSPEDYELWIKQYAETVSAAVQQGFLPDGIRRLEKLVETVTATKKSDLVVYTKFRFLTAEYNTLLQQKNADFGKIQDNYIGGLKKLVADYEGSPELADVVLALALGSEFQGKDTDAIEWFTRLYKDYPDNPMAKKAAGAKRRLQSLGQPMVLKGTTLDNKAFDMPVTKGRVVVVQYWATWCEPCKQDMEIIKKLQAKYAKQGFQPIGVNLDNTAAEPLAFLKAKPMPWPQLYEKGGLEGRFANEMGIFTLPTMILIDATGKVVNRSVTADQLDGEVAKLLK